jgi:nucleoside-diphosphate-sugar epimerase
VGAFYIKDCAAAIQWLQAAENLPHRIYNIGGDRGIRYGEFAQAVRNVVPSMQINLQPGNGPRHRPNAYMDISRIKKDVGYELEYDLDRGVAEYIDWLRSHPE